MADAVLLRKAVMKVVYLAVVVGVGHWLLWPDMPVREWLNDNSDWKLKFAFVAWAAVSVGMAYDTVVALGRGIMASPDPKRR
jgi:hypothetical protein